MIFRAIHTASDFTDNTVLRRIAELIAARTGRPIEIAMVAVRNLQRAAHLVDDEDVELVDDPFLVVNHPGINDGQRIGNSTA